MDANKVTTLQAKKEKNPSAKAVTGETGNKNEQWAAVKNRPSRTFYICGPLDAQMFGLSKRASAVQQKLMGMHLGNSATLGSKASRVEDGLIRAVKEFSVSLEKLESELKNK